MVIYEIWGQLLTKITNFAITLVPEHMNEDHELQCFIALKKDFTSIS